MPKNDYEKYLVRKPAYKSGTGVKGRQSPVMTYMSNDLVPGCNVNIEFSWIHDMPSPNPYMLEHVHNYDMVVFYIGGDPEDMNDLGGDIVYYVGSQPITFNQNASFYIPRGVKHGPVIWKEFRKPHLEMTLMLGPASDAESWTNGTKSASIQIPRKTDNIDYSKYFVREPLYLENRKTKENGLGPVRMFMCNDLIPEANVYIDYPWIFSLPKTFILEHVHDYNEVVLHIGGDPDNPEDLGGEIEMAVNGQPITFDTTTALYLPRGLKHGPLTWKKYSRPHLQMPIVLGGGTLLKAAPGGYKAE